MRAFAVPRPDTAFSLGASKGQKRPRQEDDKHLRFIRTLPCLVTGSRDVEAAHIRMAGPGYGKRETGKAEKPHDKFTVPLSAAEHRRQHSMNEAAYWAGLGIDPLKVALSLWAATGDEETCEIIIREARASARRPQPKDADHG